MNCLYGIDLAGSLVKMKNQAAAALACYSFADLCESFDVEDDKGFAEVLLLDSYFILFMLTSSESVLMSREIRSRLMLIESDHSSTENPPSPLVMPRVNELVLHRDNIMLDLLILDNQIPFFVVEELFEELKLEKPLHDYALEFFGTIHPRPNRDRHRGQNIPPKFFHLLDLFHWSRVPENKYEVVSSSHCQPDGVYWARYTPTAMELRKSATVLEKKSSGSSLDIAFRRGRIISVIGVLNIPNLHIRDYSSFVFHNLIAFEMQSQSRGRCTMAFSAFMRNLLQSEEDVKLLRRRGILANTSMTDGELVDFFKRLSRLIENYQMPSDLYAVYYQVLSHHNRRMSRFCGSIILQYFPNPLVTLSVFAAVVLFVLTLLQTIYTILSYYHY
uniref:Uncharacterized protein n=1 Tax=Ananas comosus var. bracteatus TaxID=296719 RepID=A0A6V7P1H2_ANACO|nr:unnamed protein product [Ananas comosus var. bracteatus]